MNYNLSYLTIGLVQLETVLNDLESRDNNIYRVLLKQIQLILILEKLVLEESIDILT